MGNYESRRRTKPCASCKQRRLKCQYQETLPCERCVKHGIACFYPDENLRSKAQEPSGVTSSASDPLLRHKQPSTVPLLAVSQASTATQAQVQAQAQDQAQPGVITRDESNPNVVSLVSTDGLWSNSVDQRLDTLQNAIDSVVTICQNNNIEHQHQVGLLQAQLQEQRQEIARLRHVNTATSRYPTASITNHNGASPVELPPLSTLMNNNGKTAGTPLELNKVLSIDEAKELMQIFMENMAQHMLGYQLENLSARELWYRCPVLLLSICAVACPHHPPLASKQGQLISSLKWHCSRLLNDYEAVYETKAVEQTILALIIASLWLESSQMYMSVALHLARTWRIDRRHNNELWRLWCLLYITDGTQNLVSQKSPSVYKQLEPIIKSVREHLVAHIENPELKEVLRENENDNKTEIATNKQLVLLNEVEMDKIKVVQPQLQDIKLCGLVEYHMAIESLFHDKYDKGGSFESAMGLLQPANLGIPWENNLALDKWMVSWTIALQNIDVQQDPWCLKSTLLYYNFARMHINTRWMLERKSNWGNWLEVWKSSDSTETVALRDASREVSLSAAISLLKLATRDRDVSSLFKFLPNHLYVMLFFASMVVLKYPVSTDGLQNSNIKKLRQRYNLVRDFKQMLARSSSSDREFTSKIVSNLKVLMNSFTQECIAKIKAPTNGSPVEEIIKKPDEPSASSTKKKAILAWPSINHGHP
ncbi:ZYRO0B14476p [Zygosaccharomyces rouxii]|uniref:ZYRO0B14476p n=1 Tax=Zygosaccharomyces rouxii (strain ATCC 2623 / CBS 732 / NBRC 1130 / NCYC 568 / NRRL Y-229) TaxID=559307 RepID=C5DS76_ZYGRC|nr:uncharacterized protein ZYRO0B14476g [Zygosaccharomyces rouxii]KAH9199834.1 hypothetical protein LQ764DRAFT_109103 [Zygosaccharomyces rouxii]CAR26637.1 ZYRO0B14476p [Zygosaccharomyces rouxii]